LVSRIERGESAPSFETLGKLCEVLETTAAGLFGGLTDGPPAVPERAELDRLTHSMTPEELAWFAELLRIARAKPSRK
jgi:transcriptional regulator with XRE-family HTH domain